MDASDSYLVLERMIQNGEVSLSVLESLLDSLVEQQLNTIAEHKALLALAGKVHTDNLSPP